MRQEIVESIRYKQGWITNQMDQFVPPSEEADVYERWKETWKTLDKQIDELVQENFELEQKLAAIKSLTRTSTEEKLEQIGKLLS